MKMVWGLGACSTFQATLAVQGSGARPEQPGHMLPDLRLISYHPYELPDVESERGILEILNLHFE